MASVTSGGGGDKLNTDLNLVPFIDLLSSLVLFLLISAVWLQISSIPASVSTKGRHSVSNDLPEDRISVTVTAGGHALSWPGAMQKDSLPTALAKSAQGYDFEQLKSILLRAGKGQPLKSVAVGADDEVPYGLLIETIDAVKLAGVTSIVMSTN